LYFDVRVCTEVAKGNSFGSSTISVGVSSKTGATRAVLVEACTVRIFQALGALVVSTVSVSSSTIKKICEEAYSIIYMLFAGELLTAHIAEDVTPVEALAADNVALTPPKAEDEAVSQTAGPPKCWALRV